ncbi:hypothetical protein [Anthocerotibacter panamensis]|uniref:hypothetical protein n=1 Tax=Anthocerotibacter panamensis TaxID=2857077 RepID=UPI001FDA2A37|nr:hypothetical protein [Anthocerotibacter panamensis]
MLPSFYQTFLQSRFTQRQFLFLQALLWLLTQYRTLRIEMLAQYLCLPVLAESCRCALQRFLLLEQFTLEHIWFPLVQHILSNFFPHNQPLYTATGIPA